MSIDKVLLEHSHTHVIIVCGGFCPLRIKLSLWTETMWPVELEISTLWPLIENHLWTSHLRRILGLIKVTISY